MARSHMPQSPSAIAATNLARLLIRLDQRLNSVLASGSAPPFEREKLLANIEYARKLHTQLKKGTSIEKTNGTGHSPASSVVIGHAAKVFRGMGRDEKIKEDLERWEGWIRDLEVRVEGVKGTPVVVEEPKTEEEEKVEEATVEEPEKRADTLSTTTATATDFPTYAAVTAAPAPSPSAAPSAPPANLRNRFQKSAPADQATTEAMIDQHRKEQDDLTEDLLRMAKLLKESSIQFGQSLDDEKPLLEMAAQGLDKNMEGMQGTGARLDALRKNQTVGFIRTIINIAIIVALVLLIMLVLAMPKLRR